MTRPTRDAPAGRAYLELQNQARRDRRPTDELLQLYALEGFLDRLTRSPHSERFVLKGGLLMAAFGERRPTRDIDLQGSALSNEIDTIRRMICEIAEVSLDDGLAFDTAGATAERIRDEGPYSGVRVSMVAKLATARLHFHVDVNIGDPVMPAPRATTLTRILGGEIVIRAHPLAMVYAEKIVTAIARGTASTRWRDFADIYLLSRSRPIGAHELTSAIQGVATHRGVELNPLHGALERFGEIGQQKWVAWRRRQQLEDRHPERFSDVIDSVMAFADPVITGEVGDRDWNPELGEWE